MINIENISKNYGKNVVLKGLSLSVENETVAVMGKSGSGKTTLLRIIAGLEKPDAGTVRTDSDIAFSFAEPRLFESVSVIENVTCVMSGKDSLENTKKASEILSALGLGDVALKLPSELSSGMAQRVSLARLIASDRNICLLDEPLRGLDTATKTSVISLLKAYLNGKCAVIVTHSEEEAKALSDKVLTLQEGILR